MYIKSTRFHIGRVKNLLFGLVVKISFLTCCFSNSGMAYQNAIIFLFAICR